MTAQAMQMKDFVQELLTIVGGNSTDTSARETSKERKPEYSGTINGKTGMFPVEKYKPEQIIPLEGQFKDF